MISIDGLSAEERYECEPLDTLDPAKAYDRDYMMAMLTRALSRLKAGFEADGQLPRFEILKPFLLVEEDCDYTEAARKLGTSVGATRTAVSRLRDRLREIFKEEFAHTVATPEDVDAEIAYMISLLSA